MTATEIPVDNGVNVEALLGVRDALPGTPEIARFRHSHQPDQRHRRGRLTRLGRAGEARPCRTRPP